LPIRKPVDVFFRLLTDGSGRNVFNPWTERDERNDGTLNGPGVRLDRLRAHLRQRPARILLGEAAGYQGCRVSGIPFTSERLIMVGSVPRIDHDGSRLSLRPLPWSEPSATTVWRTLHTLRIAEDTLLWNAYPWHPHLPGKPHSNRTPSRTERALGTPVLRALLLAFPDASLFAVGRHAQHALLEAERTAYPLRHPSMGGARLFEQGLRDALRRTSRLR
jgi:uracil-DNA glycosylase